MNQLDVSRWDEMAVFSAELASALPTVRASFLYLALRTLASENRLPPKLTLLKVGPAS